MNKHSHKAEKQNAKAKLSFVLTYYIGFDIPTEHATNVSHFMTDLAGLSNEAMREILSLTGPPVFDIPKKTAEERGYGHDDEDDDDDEEPSNNCRRHC